MFKSVCFASRYVYRCHAQYYSRMKKPQITTHKTRYEYQPKGPKAPLANDNPGVDNTLQALLDEGVITSKDELDQELLENSESDFFNVNKSHRDHENEMLKKKDMLKKQIVKQKYFKENTPNLLTWSEKEQIRYLHNKDPVEWTLERLVDSFPMTIDTAKKIINVTWKPSTQIRINRHDASVIRNWKELEEDTLAGVSPGLRRQFLKFSKRNIPPRSQKDIEETLKLSAESKPIGEFSQLIDGYRNEAEEMYKKNILSKIETPKAIESKLHEEYDSDITETDKNSKHSNKIITLESLRENIMLNVENNEEIELEDKYLIAPDTKSKDLSNVNLEGNSLYETDTDMKLPQKFKEKIDKEMELMDYMKRIRIPKKAYKKGTTYKVNDCYYDSDGQFLYRVPGMTENYGNKTNIEEQTYSNEPHRRSSRNE
ncbi:uncharacterized protein LOC143909416 isoform X2 [Arctopsyche grandis]